MRDGIDNATLSIMQPDGTMSEPVPMGDVVRGAEALLANPETGEITERAGQMLLGDDPAFVRPTPAKRVDTIKVAFSGTVEMPRYEYITLTQGKQAAPGLIVYFKGAGYIPAPHVAWVKRSEKDEATGEKNVWFEPEGRVTIKATDLAGFEITDDEWSGDE
jgi:hypothetical protein